jgi:hypothetical protein
VCAIRCEPLKSRYGRWNSRLIQLARWQAQVIVADFSGKWREEWRRILIRDRQAGQPIAGVTVTIKSPLNTGSGSTDKQGKYAVTVLCTEQSKHTVTPSKAGYTFQPTSRPWDKYTGGPSFTGKKVSK